MPLLTHSRKSNSLAADLVFNVGSQMFLRVVTAITALYAARVLGPAQFGVWAVLQVLFMYTAQGHLGTANAMMREVPLLRSRGHGGEAQNVINSTLGFITTASVLVTVGAGALVWRLYVPAGEHGWFVVLGSMWLTVVQLQSVFFQFYCRANSNFKVMAAFSITQAFITLPLSLWLIPRFGIAGYLFALATGFSIIPLAIVSRPGIRFRVNIADWRRLLGSGLPMLPGALMLYLNMSMERLVLASGLSSLSVGFFAAGAFLFQIGGSVWELIVYTWYSRLTAIYGRSGSINALAEVMREFLPGAIWVSSVAQGALFVTMPYVMTRLLPAYAQSVGIAQTLVVVMNLWGIAQFLSFSLTIIGRQRRSVMLQVTFLGVKLGFVMSALLIWHEPLAVAVFSALALIVYAGLTWREWRRLSKQRFPDIGLPAVLCGTPVLLAVVCCHLWPVVSWASALGSLTTYSCCALVLSFMMQGRIGLRRGLVALRSAE